MPKDLPLLILITYHPTQDKGKYSTCEREEKGSIYVLMLKGKEKQCIPVQDVIQNKTCEKKET
eukprot:754718-Ditylum_brightwellii.AAC.1